jgi:hypothetical protein
MNIFFKEKLYEEKYRAEKKESVFDLIKFIIESLISGSECHQNKY